MANNIKLHCVEDAEDYIQLDIIRVNNNEFNLSGTFHKSFKSRPMKINGQESYNVFVKVGDKLTFFLSGDENG